MAKAGEHAGAEHDDGRDLGGGIDVLLAGADVAGDDEDEPPASSKDAAIAKSDSSSMPAMPASVPSSVKVRMPPSRASGPVA